MLGAEKFHFKPTGFHGLQYVPQMIQLAAGKDVFGQQPAFRVHFPKLFHVGFAWPCNALHQKQTVLGQQRADGFHVARQIVDPDSLVHADRGDLVELAFKVRVVAKLDRDLIL